jgi:hypothetical protein
VGCDGGGHNDGGMNDSGGGAIKRAEVLQQEGDKRATSRANNATDTQTGGPQRGTWYSEEGDTKRPVSFGMMVEA